MTWLPELYRRARRRLAWASDRVAEATDRTLLSTLGAPPWIAALAGPVLRVVGGTAAWTRLPPRLPVSALESGEVRLTLQGPEADSPWLADALGLADPAVRPVRRHLTVLGGRRLSADIPASGWFVGALPRGAGALGARPRSAYCVTTLSNVGHLVDLTVPFSLQGGERKKLRQSLARLDHVTLQAEFTRSRDDFTHFHEQLYRPHVARRHGTRAVLVEADRQWRQWFGRGGGLLLLRVDGIAAIGCIVHQTGRCVALVEEGLNEALAREPYFGALQAALKRAAIDWARTEGARLVYLGLSPAAASHGIYRSKRLWGARPIVPPRVMQPHWTFQANALSAADRYLFNSRRFVSIHAGRPVVVRVLAEDGTYDGPHRTDDDVATDGLQGIVEVWPGRTRFRPLGKHDDE